jgi:hypothetical protein
MIHIDMEGTGRGLSRSDCAKIGGEREMNRTYVEAELRAGRRIARRKPEIFSIIIMNPKSPMLYQIDNKIYDRISETIQW